MLPSPRLDIASDHDFVETAAAVRNFIAVTLDNDAGDWADARRFVDRRHLGIAKAAIGTDVQPHGDTAAFEAEDCLAIFHARGTDAARAEDAAVMVKINIGMCGVDLSSGPLIGLRWGYHAKPIAERLELAITACHAVRTRMIAFQEEHFDDHTPVIVELRRMVFDDHAVGRWRDAGRAIAAIDLTCTDPAVT